jgi:hypothetical protein
MKMTQIIATFAITFAMSPAYSQTPSLEYSCRFIPQLGGTGVGAIVIHGDPVKNIYQSVSIAGVPQRIRPGATEQVYLYLYNQQTGAKSFALEVVNFGDGYNSFELSVYGPDHIVLGSRRIGRYRCYRAL